MKRSSSGKKTRVWICGQLRGEWRADGSRWDFQGVFSNVAKAVNACRNKKYFLFTATLDKELPDFAIVPNDARYPMTNTSIKAQEEKARARDEVEIVLQVNGKIRGHVVVPTGLNQKELEEIALVDPRISKVVEGKTVRKIVVVPNKLVNIAAR